jgi:hypothetical protein
MEQRFEVESIWACHVLFGIDRKAAISADWGYSGLN